jgi:hypothetical protein
MRSALFWAVTQRVVVIHYRRFGTAYPSHLHGSINPRKTSQKSADLVHYPVHNNLPIVSIRSQINPVHTIPCYFCKANFLNKFPCKPTSPRWFLSFIFLNKNPVSLLFLNHATCPAHPILLDLIVLIIMTAGPSGREV